MGASGRDADRPNRSAPTELYNNKNGRRRAESMIAESRNGRRTGTMDGRTFVYEIPDKYEIDEVIHDALIKTFRQAIALCSKQWQVEQVLNDYWGIEGGKFYEL